MGITKKAYAKKFGDALVENPRKFLRGHGIKASGWNIINGEVADGAMLAELMYFAHSLTGAKRGPMALKKADNFNVKTYRTEGMLIDSLSDDVDSFVEGLSEKDAKEFENNENIHVIGYFPAYKDGSPVARLKLSVLLRNGYKGKFGKGQFVVIFFGNSALRTSELTFAKAKAKTNAKKAIKVTRPSVIKARLKKKAKKVIGKIESKVANLEGDAQLMSAELQQFNSIGKTFGLDGDFTTTDIENAMRNNDESNAILLAGMTDVEKGIWDLIEKESKKKSTASTRIINNLVKSSNSAAIRALHSNLVTNSSEIVGEREKAIKSKVRELNTRTRKLNSEVKTLTVDRSVATKKGNKDLSFKLGKKISALNFAIRKNKKNVQLLKSKLGVVSAISGEEFVSFDDRAEVLSTVKAEIARLTARGATERQALSAALKKVDMPEDVKQQVAQQAQQAIEDGVPTQLAMQEAMQQVPYQQVSAELADDFEGSDDLDDVVMDWL